MHFDPEERANLTTPEGFRIELSTIPGAGFGGFTERFVPKHTILGSYEGLTHLHHREDDLYSWQVRVRGQGQGSANEPCTILNCLLVNSYTANRHIQDN